MTLLFHPWSGDETDRITPCLPVPAMHEAATSPLDEGAPPSDPTVFVPPARYASMVASTGASDVEAEPVTVRSPLVGELARALAQAEERALAYDAAPPPASQCRPRLTPDELATALATPGDADDLSPSLVGLVTFLVALTLAMLLRAAVG